MEDQKLITLTQLTDLASRVKSTTDSLSGEITSLADVAVVERDIATDKEVDEALKTIFSDAVPIGEAAVDEAKKDFGTFGKDEDLYEEGSLTRTWVGSNCKLEGKLNYFDTESRGEHTGLWADGNYVAIGLKKDDFQDKAITWKFSNEKTGDVGDTDYVVRVQETTKHQPIIAKCNGRVIATFDLNDLTLKTNSEDP